MLVADASGNVVRKIAYDSFGNIIEDTNPTFAVPFGFAGGLHDRDTGLVRFGYRDYDPDVGRWTAKDPILFAGGDTDLYGYCLNDPVNLTDTVGLRNDTSGISDGITNEVEIETQIPELSEPSAPPNPAPEGFDILMIIGPDGKRHYFLTPQEDLSTFQKIMDKINNFLNRLKRHWQPLNEIDPNGGRRGFMDDDKENKPC